MGLSLGAIFFAAATHGPAADHAASARLAQAAARGYAGSYLDAQGEGLRAGAARFGFRDADAESPGAERVSDPKQTAEARRRADLECMTDAVYYEARGESARGQAAVAQVVMNRVKHPNFPKSVCAVVFQRAGHRGCQFSFACDGSMREAREGLAWDRARQVAARVLAGAALVNIGTATHFHTLAVSPDWAPQMLRVATVGMHVFYKPSPYHRDLAVDAFAEKAVLTAQPERQAPLLRLEPALVEKAVETSLQPAAAASADPKAKPAPPAAKPAEAAELTGPQPVSAGAS
ncbi:MAG TPA: cell wall hydrolase [Phenylobacterium sp.]|nr:cell wall hydrolase [Phenylobacterium sp.]